MERFIWAIFLLFATLAFGIPVTKVGGTASTKVGGSAETKVTGRLDNPFPPTNLGSWWDSNIGLTLTGLLPNVWTDSVGGKTLTAVATAHPMSIMTVAGRQYVVFDNGAAASGGYFTMDASLTWNQQAVSWYFIYARTVKTTATASMYWGATGNDAGLFAGQEWEHWNGSGITSSGLRGMNNIGVYFVRVNGGTNVKIGISSQIATISSNPGAGTNTGGVVGEWNGPPAFPLDVGLLIGILKYDEYTSDATHTAILAAAANYYKSTPETASKLWVTTGDSRTFGADTTYPLLYSYPAQMARSYTTQPYYANTGVSGTTAQGETSGALTTQQFGYVSGMGLIASYGFGVNDIIGGRSSAQIIADISTWISNVRAAYPAAILVGNTIFTFTGASGGQETIRAAVNTWITTTAPPVGFNYATDLAGDVRLQDPTNATYFFQGAPSPGLHLSDAGNAAAAQDEKAVFDANSLLP